MVFIWATHVKLIACKLCLSIDNNIDETNAIKNKSKYKLHKSWDTRKSIKFKWEKNHRKYYYTNRNF